jgi:hypothetical protein
MSKNIIQILKSGNQELFYSAFIAWLLDPSGEHGLNDQFLNWFLHLIGEPQLHIDSIKTEEPLACGRVDIFIRTANGRKIIVENKTKSIGTNEQIERYKNEKYADKVVLLGFVSENFPESSRDKVVTYTAILDFLRNATRTDSSLSVLVDHFISYLESTISPFTLFHKFCNNQIDINNVSSELSKYSNVPLNDNDCRFFQAIYFERLKAFISDNFANLIFGNTEYNQENDAVKPAATKWYIKKNMQGPPFMEAIIFNKEVPGKLRLSDKWLSTFAEAQRIDLCPRIEFYGKFGPNNFYTQDDVAVFLLGCWDEGLMKAFQASDIFKKRRSRNFHHRILKLNDLKYQKMASIIIEEMEKIWTFY